MKDYLFILVNSSGRFYAIHEIKLNAIPKLNDVFELAPDYRGKWKVIDYEGSIGEYGKLIHGVYVLENIS